MKLHLYFVPVALALALAACRPAASEYSEAEAPKDLRLDNATTHVDLRFAPGSTRLVGRDAARLRALVGTGGLQPADRVLVATGGSPGLARARFEAIATELAPYRIVASPKPVAVGPNQAIVESVRYLVTLPACPNWTGPGPHDFTNSGHSNFGCADQVNLGRMVASPADLVEGRPVAATEGTPAAAAVNRYLTDKVQLPTAATVGPIAAQPAAAPAAAAGGPTGSTP
jgi:pilus assembly protein CpaD